MDPIENFVSRGLGSDTPQRSPPTPNPPLYIPSQLSNLRPNLLVSQVGNPSHPPVRYYTLDGSTYGVQPMNLFPQFISTQDSHNVSCSQDTSKSIHSASSVEISSPTKGKKRKSLEKGEDSIAKKGTPNKKWKPQHTEVLIPYLVDLASQGFKCFKTFKSPAFKKAADHVNQICSETYTPQNVENHLKSLKEKWKMISDVRKLSGAGWDEETKTIILDEETMKEYIEKHPKHKSFINTPIPHYEDLKIICGEDNATGEYMGTAFDEDLARDIPTINIDDEPSTEEGVDVVLYRDMILMFDIWMKKTSAAPPFHHRVCFSLLHCVHKSEASKELSPRHQEMREGYGTTNISISLQKVVTCMGFEVFGSVISEDMG